MVSAYGVFRYLKNHIFRLEQVEVIFKIEDCGFIL